MKTILLQEWDEATLEMVTAALQMEGYCVRGVTDTDGNLIEMIRRHRPRLVLLDCWLQHHSGQRTVQWIKAHFPAMPVIALSCDLQIGEEYRKLGFDDYLVKPFDLDALYRVVSSNLPGRTKRQPDAPRRYPYAITRKSANGDHSDKTLVL